MRKWYLYNHVTVFWLIFSHIFIVFLLSIILVFVSIRTFLCIFFIVPKVLLTMVLQITHLIFNIVVKLLVSWKWMLMEVGRGYLWIGVRWWEKAEDEKKMKMFSGRLNTLVTPWERKKMRWFDICDRKRHRKKIWYWISV